jgi:hypothetical protein
LLKDVSMTVLIPKTPGWGIYNFGGEVHVLPVDELSLHTEYEDCLCGTHRNESIIVHASFDGREQIENGTRKPS